jgi:predicted Zn-dependent protease
MKTSYRLPSILASVLALALLPLGAEALTLFSEKQMAQSGAQSYAEMKQKTPISKDAALNARVACVAGPLTDLVGGRDKWEFTVFDTDDVNAFAMPGGKIGVYRGLFTAAVTPAQLAAVLGHEIGHVKAKHANKRASTELLTNLGVEGVQLLTGKAGSSKYMSAALGVGSQYGILLPFSRDQESEADQIGLKLMARAGFDPNEAVQLWKNMQKVGGKGPPAFLSTHPSNKQRIDDIAHRIPDVMPLYQAVPKKPKCG